jgi:hypothetical protein
MHLQYFFYLTPLLATEFKRGKLRYTNYFLNDYLVGVQIEKMKNMCFMGCRMEAFMSCVYKQEMHSKFSVLFA